MGQKRLLTIGGAAMLALLITLPLAGPAAGPASAAYSGEDPGRLPRHSSDLPGSATAPRIDARVANADVEYFRIPGESWKVAPGISFASFDQYDGRGWFRAQVITANINKKAVTLDHLGPPKVAQRESLVKLGKRKQTKKKRIVAAVNADFFDIGDTGAPLGNSAERKRGVLQGRTSGWNNVFMINKAGKAKVAQTALKAKVKRGNGTTLAVSNLNSPTVFAGSIGIYTPVWGSTSRARVVDNARNVREVVIRKGRVVANRAKLSSGPIGKGRVVLVGRDGGANRLKQLKVGSRAKVTWKLAKRPKVALGGSEQLLKGGRIVTGDDGPMHPRTAIGVKRSNGRVIMLTVDGRQSHSRGLTLVETARVMRELGADDAINLDGGGSTTMLARRPGRNAQVANAPSDGGLRSVPNGVGIQVKSSRKLKAIEIEGLTGPLAVFPGLRRTVRGIGRDNRFGKAPLPKPTWKSGAKIRAGGGKKAIVTGTTAGNRKLVAVAKVKRKGKKGKRKVKSKTTIRVLGPLARIDTDRSAISLARGATSYFTVHGYDAAGATTTIDPRDVSLSYDTSVASISKVKDGRFKVVAKQKKAGIAVTVTVAGKRAVLGLSVAGAALPATAIYDPTPWASPIVMPRGQRAPGTFRVAVVADALVGPGRTVRNTVLTGALEQAVASGADLVVGAGDNSHSGSPADLREQVRIFTETLGPSSTGYRLVPGEREMGVSLQNVRQHLYGGVDGPVRQQPYGNLAFMYMNTATGSYRSGGFGQLPILRDQLAAAARNPAVNRVVVFGHHPLLATTHGVAVSDAREARLVLQMLEHFRKTSGKQIAYVAAHGGRFEALRHEGVDLITMGSIRAANGPAVGGGVTGVGYLAFDAGGNLRVEFP